ncbi:hypothetical protein MML48_4g00000393 [Holotrichia oblita]|uniref:Uncharacterized protein n=1 Tax=Holotrichia oblita TaxID=644536 RepID=A0ACB9T929_HOLOL|nr:hypothetical protein MML48_4g00000393 [Holotrichia oblita]
MNIEKVLEKCVILSLFTASPSSCARPSVGLSAGPSTGSSRTASPPPSSKNSLPSTPRKILELSLLEALKRVDHVSRTQKRSRVQRKLAESLTSDDVRQRLEINERKKLEKKGLKPNEKNKLKKMKTKPETSRYDSEVSLPSKSDSGPFRGKYNYSNDQMESVPSKNTKDSELSLQQGSWVLVRFVIHKAQNPIYTHYFGKIISTEDKKTFVSFLRKDKNHFVYPDVPHEQLVNSQDVVQILSVPRS